MDKRAEKDSVLIGADQLFMMAAILEECEEVIDYLNDLGVPKELDTVSRTTLLDRVKYAVERGI